MLKIQCLLYTVSPIASASSLALGSSSSGGGEGLRSISGEPEEDDPLLSPSTSSVEHSFRSNKGDYDYYIGEMIAFGIYYKMHFIHSIIDIL